MKGAEGEWERETGLILDALQGREGEAVEKKRCKKRREENSEKVKRNFSINLSAGEESSKSVSHYCLHRV